MNDKTPWLLLVASWVYFSAPKNSIQKLLALPAFQNNKLPWILLVLSWGWFSAPRETHRKLFLLFGRKPSLRKYTAKYIPTIPTSKIVEVDNQDTIKKDDSIRDNQKKKLSDMHIEEILEELQPEIANLPVRHKHSSINRAIAVMKRVLPKDEWQVQNENNGITISMLSVEGLGLPFIRGDGVVQGNWSIEEVMSVVQNSYARDPRFDSAQILEFMTSKDVLIYSVQKGTFPVAARDLVTISTFDLSVKEGMYAVCSAKDESKAPATNGKVRADLLIAGWNFVKTEKGVMCTYLVHVDPKGSIPAVQQQTPMCIKGVSDFLNEYGTCPTPLATVPFAPTSDIHLLKRDSVLDKMELEYELKVTSPVGSEQKQGSIFIALPKKAFNLGANIHIKSTSPKCEFHARLVPRSEIGEIVSEATVNVVHIWSSGVEENSIVTCTITAGSKYTLNESAIF